MWIRLKLMAPFHRPRRPRPRGEASASASSPLPCLRLAMTALRLDHAGFALHGRPANLLVQGWTIDLARRGRELDPTPAGHRLEDGLVDESFLAGRLGRPALPHALRKIDQLGRELVALGELPLTLPCADRQ